MNNPIRSLYDWVLRWADTPYAIVALTLIAFAESSFFPIPPDILLIAMAMAAPSRGFLFAGWCTIGSVVGGVVGYGIGVGLMDAVGCRVIRVYHGEAIFDRLADVFRTYDFWAVFTAAVTPIPYKIFTITAGAVGADFWTFLAASAVGRPLRFFAVALAIYCFGPPVKRFIEKYFDLLSVVFVVLLVGGFAAVKLLSGESKHGAETAHATASPFAEICEVPTR